MQRALGIGYGRAARLIDFMAEDGIVGQYNGSQAREILITLADWERMQGLSTDDGAPETDEPTARTAATQAPPRRNIVKPEAWEEEPDDVEASEMDDKSSEVETDEADDGDDEEYQAASA